VTQENRPPLFTAKSLRIFTKIVAIYAAFVILTVIAQVISKPRSENPLAPSNAYMPIYVYAGLHFIFGLINFAVIVSKRYNWFVPSLSAIVLLTYRLYYDDLALWVWSWS